MEPQKDHQRDEAPPVESLESQPTDLSDLVKGDYYSVFLPCDNDTKIKKSQVNQYIFQDKIEALKMVKNTKKARFRHFETYDAAHKFASCGEVEQTKRDKTRDFQSNGVLEAGGPTVMVEKLSLFKGPKPQDLVNLRKIIEVGNCQMVKKLIWENPRYLVSSGDTPSILQEGFRYNALHVTARHQHAEIADLILSTISDGNFIRHLYGDDNRENIENRIQVLLDLYLNTPDRGANETPLHFACKWGAVGVAEVLVSYAQCDKTLKNKHGQTAFSIIGDRFDDKMKKTDAKKQLQALLQNNYYVPVLRAEDNSMMPTIGEPFSLGNSPVPIKDPMSPRMEIHAYAGPMNKDGADHFRKVWKTPPRSSTPHGTPVKATKKNDDENDLDSILALRYTDPVKGLERVGQKLANQFNISWKEYWPFLDNFVDITSEQGLALFETHMSDKVAVAVFELEPPKKSKNTKNDSTISELCLGIQGIELSDDSSATDEEIQIDDGVKDGTFASFLFVDKACSVFAYRLAFDIVNKINNKFNFVVSHLEGQVRQLQLLTMSYMEDGRFKQINFRSMHPRIGQLMANSICLLVSLGAERKYFLKKLEDLRLQCNNTFDCFSSDDEEAVDEIKPSTTKRQLVCVLKEFWIHYKQEVDKQEPDYDVLNEEEARAIWKQTKECRCVIQRRTSRRGSGLLKTNHKRNSKNVNSDFQKSSVVPKKLFNVEERIEPELNGAVPLTEPNSDEETYYTPPTTPTKRRDCSDDEEYADTSLLPGVFIEGPEPTKTDCAVFKALRLNNCVIDPEVYPSIYRWHHCMTLYSDEERDRWPSYEKKKQDVPSSPATAPVTPHVNYFSPPPLSNSSPPAAVPTPNKSWMRITGVHSPRSTLQTNNRV